MGVIVESGFGGRLEERALKSMFEDRKSVFVDLLNWDLPVLDGRFEVDEFDDEHATYVIVADDKGDHLGSARLLPTARRHILGSLFSELCAGSPPQGPGISEITRFCLSRRQTSHSRRQTRNRLITALVSHALERGIRTFTGVAEVSWLQQILAFGWNCRPLGLPLRFDCGLIGALAIEVGPETPMLLARNGIWDAVVEPPVQIQKAA